MPRPDDGGIRSRDGALGEPSPDGVGPMVDEGEKEQAGPALAGRSMEVEHLLEEIARADRAGIHEDRTIPDAELRADPRAARRIEPEMIEVDAGGNDAPR